MRRDKFIDRLVNISGLIEVGATCGSGWIQGPYKSCYKFVMFPKVSWEVANGLCRDMAGRLATLETKGEIIWIRGYRSYHADLREEIAWIGGYNKEGKWYWKGELADSPVQVTDWGKGQPDGPDGYCMELLAEQSGPAGAATEWFRFDDYPCGESRSYICEKEVNE